MPTRMGTRITIERPLLDIGCLQLVAPPPWEMHETCRLGYLGGGTATIWYPSLRNADVSRYRNGPSSSASSSRRGATWPRAFSRLEMRLAVARSCVEDCMALSPRMKDAQPVVHSTRPRGW